MSAIDLFTSLSTIFGFIGFFIASYGMMRLIEHAVMRLLGGHRH